MARLVAAGLIVAATLPVAAAQTQDGAQPAPHPRHHHRHRAAVHAAPAPRAAPPPVAAQQADGSEPAPVPDENIGPPRRSTDETSVDPGAPQIHYPSLGNGFLPGSSSQTLENLRSGQVPGATVHVPVQQPPQTLPPPAKDGQ